MRAANPNLLNYDIHKVGTRYDIKPGGFTGYTGPVLPSISGKLEQGQFEIHTKFAKVNIDSYEARASCGFGFENPTDEWKHWANRAKGMVDASITDSVDFGDRVVKGEKPSDIIKSRVKSDAVIRTRMDWYPKKQVKYHTEKSDIQVDATRSKHKTSWTGLETNPLRYKQGNVNISMVGREGVDFTYTGDMDYFPDEPYSVSGTTPVNWYA